MKTIWKHIISNYKNQIFLGICGVLTGALVGVLEAFFGLVLQRCTGLREEHLHLLAPFLPLAGAAIVFLYRRLGKRASQGMKLVFRVGLGDDRDIPVRMIPLAMLSTWMTHLCGGSAGREGVAIQIGAAVSDNLDRLVKRKWTVEKGEQIFLLTGMAAGLPGCSGRRWLPCFLRWRFWWPGNWNTAPSFRRPPPLLRPAPSPACWD